MATGSLAEEIGLGRGRVRQHDPVKREGPSKPPFRGAPVFGLRWWRASAGDVRWKGCLHPAALGNTGPSHRAKHASRFPNRRRLALCLARAAGVEPTTARSEAGCSIR